MAIRGGSLLLEVEEKLVAVSGRDVSADDEGKQGTYFRPTCLKVMPRSVFMLRASPPCGLLLTVMLERSTFAGSFSAIWGMMSGNAVVGSTVSRNWPSLLTNQSIMAASNVVYQ